MTPDEIFNSVESGWRVILELLLKDLEKLGWNGEVLQVKEKFGGLRFYIDVAPPEVPGVYERIRKAEVASMTTCEFCGNPGTLENIRGWWKTLCGPCAEARLIKLSR